MAPFSKPARSGSDKQVKSMKAILSFAAQLCDQLPTAASSNCPGSLSNEIEKYISEFPSNLGQAGTLKCEEIDNNGTRLWNLSTRLRRTHDSDSPNSAPIIILKARVFAFLLLDCAQQGGNDATSNIMRLTKVGIKATKHCMDQDQLGLALKVLEKVGGYELLLEKQYADLSAQDGEVYRRLSAEYFVLRTALAWRQDQLEIAEHMFKRSISSQQCFDPSTAESLADVLYELGKDLIGKHQYPMAVKWLERAYEILSGQELERLSMDASELRISIIESWIRALMGLNEPESTEKARSLVDLLESEIGDRLIVLLLRLELLSAATNESFDCNSYVSVLQRMTRTMILNDANLKLILFHIRKLSDKSPSLSCKALDELLRLRLLQSDMSEWIEKILITRLWMTVNQGDSLEALISIEDAFSTMVANIIQPISSSATLAAHMLLWKRIESNYAQGQYDVAEKWCRLAMHKVFEKSGGLNMARISRKLLLCAISKHDLGSAKDIFGAMSTAAQNEPMTRFLMYKVAIRYGEVELAAQCLEIISSSAAKDLTILYACVLDAQQLGNKSQALAALQLVLDKCGYEGPIKVHLPSLLRVTIGLMVSVLEASKTIQGSVDAEANVEQLCKLFEGAATSVSKTPLLTDKGVKLWTVLELDWFSKNSYNLSIKHLATWSPRHSLRMLVCCISFIDQYPQDISAQVSDDLSLRKMFCEFSAATALVALARGEDNVESQLNDYLNLRKHVSSFDAQLQGKLEKLEEGPTQDLLQKLAILLAFDFEAACRLRAWDDLGNIILRAVICKSIRVYELMADCVLSTQAPTAVLITTLKKIINEAWGFESLDSTKLAKYMRCLFQVAISDNAAIAEQLLDQVYNLAEEASESNHPYPEEELEWITTRAFNYAVDLYCAGDDDASKNWAGKALNIAHFCADGGALERLLQTKLLGLKWDL